MKTQQDEYNQCDQAQLQKRGVVYSHDVMNCDIVRAENHMWIWESLDLSQNQKLYRLVFSYSVLSQLMLHIKKLKKATDQSAVNTLRRMTRRNEKKTKKE